MLLSIIIEKCLVPLIAFSSVLAVAGNISDRGTAFGIL